MLVGIYIYIFDPELCNTVEHWYTGTTGSHGPCEAFQP